MNTVATFQLFSRYTKRFLFVLGMGLLLFSCIEEIPLETETFESALVVEATITDEDTRQVILLSRTFQFEDEGPSPESGAGISIFDTAGNEYIFQESGTAGTYVSESEFSLIDGREYQLAITTSDGNIYESEAIEYTEGGSLDALYAERTVSAEGTVGVSFFVDSFDPTGNSNYYRFEYDETYKIVSNYFTSEELIVVSDSPPYSVALVPKEEDESICYNTRPSQVINISSTIALQEDRIERQQVRFIERINPIVSSRYSILVTQYVISQEAFAFYDTLESFSSNESLFSQVQPGFIVGNIKSISNDSEKVIGIFELATISRDRIFINYSDIFSSDDGPPGMFVEECPISRPEVPQLVNQLQSGLVNFLYVPTEPGNDDIGYGPYVVVPRPCIDCRVFGTNETPDFWTE